MQVTQLLALTTITMTGLSAARAQDSDRPVFPQTTWTPQPVVGEIRLVPSMGEVVAGGTFSASINVKMAAGATARGLTIQMVLPTGLASVVNGASGIHLDPGSPYVFANESTIEGDLLTTSLLHPSFERVNYSGPVVELDFAVAPGTEGQWLYLELNPATTIFHPVLIPGLALGGEFIIVAPSPTPTPPPVVHGDLDRSGCTDIADFLFLIDHWQETVDGLAINMGVFLDLLDHWQTGGGC